MSFGLSAATLGTIAAVGAITAGVGAVGAGTASAVQYGKNKKASRLAAAAARREEKRLKMLENMRQPVIDQSNKVRALKNQVFNPNANLGVAMKASELQMEETDKALANTLDAIRAGGAGAGNATALAQMAAFCKASVGANIETQELSNQQSRIQGEATRQQTLMDIEKTALSEEVSAWNRTEERELASMDRSQNLIDRDRQQAIAYDQAAQANASAAWGSLSDLGLAAVDFGTGGASSNLPDLGGGDKTDDNS